MNGGIDLKKRLESFILFRRPFVFLVRRHEVTSPSPSARAYCFAAAGGFASGSPTGAAPRSSAAGVQSPAQSLVPLTVPTNLQPIGTCGLTCFVGLPALGASV